MNSLILYPFPKRYQTYKDGGGSKYNPELGVTLSHLSTPEILHYFNTPVSGLLTRIVGPLSHPLSADLNREDGTLLGRVSWSGLWLHPRN